jgi:hypothetical protein
LATIFEEIDKNGNDYIIAASGPPRPSKRGGKFSALTASGKRPFPLPVRVMTLHRHKKSKFHSLSLSSNSQKKYKPIIKLQAIDNQKPRQLDSISLMFPLYTPAGPNGSTCWLHPGFANAFWN